jgi:hemerythrin-like domain-containing protein
MKPTAVLIQEHERIRRVLIVMSKISDELKVTRVFYPEELEVVAGFIFIHWDKCHCRKEEKVLYPALVAGMVSVDTDDIAFMIQEHKYGKNYLKEIRSCIENCKIGNPFSVDMLVDCMSTYSSMIKNHMANEENYFFPLADKMLLKEVQDQVLDKFESIDKLLAKQNNYAECLEEYKKLEKKYLRKMSYIEAGNSNFFGINC